jgi:hypothetical protein
MFRRSNPGAFAALLFLVCWLASLPAAHAQLVKIEAGASDLLPSEGGSIAFQGPNYTGYIGAGDISGSFGMGGYLKTTFRSHVITLGDQPVAFDLPTDIFATNHVYPTRGLGITAQEGKANVFLFVGGTALVNGTQFFQSAKADLPAAMLFTDVPISPTLHLYSKNVLSRQRTSIEALDWHPRKWLRGGFAGGLGSNHPYLAATAGIEKNWISLKAAYISASDRFRRITATSIFAAEVDRENILAVIKPSSSLLLNLGHQNLLQPQSPDPAAPFLHATVNQASANLDYHEFRIGAGAFQSTFQKNSTVAENLSVSRKITNRLDVSVNHFRALSGTGPHVSNLSSSIRETISPRLSLLQVINYSQGRTTVLYGGSYLSNRFTLGIDYQTLYLPFRANPFSQGINVSLRLRLFGGLQVNGQTYRSADGRLRYTAFGEGLLAGNFRPARNETEQTFKHLRYLVRGRVLDEKGEPVDGAAVHIGEELIYTNAAGEFFSRRKTASILPMQVLFSEFLNPAPFSLISAPQTVIPALDSAAPEVLVILRRN